MSLDVDVLTIFPHMFPGPLGDSITGRALEAGIATVRALDIRNPFQPKEVGYFIPAITDKTDKRCVKIDGKDRCRVAIQTNNVETDARGYVYIVDRANTGMHVLELTGEPRGIAGLRP